MNLNLSRIFIERPVMTALVCFAILLFGTVAFSRLAGGGAAERGLSDHPGDRRRFPAPIRRPWPRPWPRRSSASSRPSPASIDELHRTRRAAPRSRCSSRSTATSTPPRRISSRPFPKPAGSCRPTCRVRPSFQKVNPAEQPILFLASAPTRCRIYTVDEYAETLLAQRISMVSGVSQVQVFGGAEIRGARAGGSGRSSPRATSASMKCRRPSTPAT